MTSPLTTASPTGPPSSTASPRGHPHHPAPPAAKHLQSYPVQSPPVPHGPPQPHTGPQPQPHAHHTQLPYTYPPPQALSSHASRSYYHQPLRPSSSSSSSVAAGAAPAFTAVVPPPSHSHSHFSFTQRPLTLNPTSTAATFHPQQLPHHALVAGTSPPLGPQLHHHHHHYSYPPHLDPADASVLSGPPAQTTRFLAANWHSARTAALNLEAGGKGGAQVPVQRTPQTLKRHDFVQALVATAAEIIDALYPTPPTVVIPLPTFIAEILRRSKSSFSTLQLALFYLFKYRAAFMRRMALEAATRSAMQAAVAAAKETDSALPSPPTVDESPPMSPAIPAGSGQHPAPLTGAASTTPATAPSGSNAAPGVRSLATCGRRLFLAALILAAKYLQDKNYSNKAWAKISGLTALEINRNEREFLDTMDYGLFVSAAKFARWSALLVSHINAVHHARQEQLTQAQQQQRPSLQRQQQPTQATPVVPSVSTPPVTSRPASRTASATPPPVSAIVTHKAILAFDFLPPQTTPPPTASGAPATSSSNGSRPISRTASPVSGHATHLVPRTAASSASSPAPPAATSGHASPSSTSTTHASRRPPPATAVTAPHPPPHLPAPTTGQGTSASGSPSTFIVSGAPHMSFMSHSMIATAVNLRDGLPRHMRARPATETLSPENKDVGGSSGGSGSAVGGSPATGIPLLSSTAAGVPGSLGLVHSTAATTAAAAVNSVQSTTPVMPPPSAEGRIHQAMHSGGTTGTAGSGGGVGGSGSADRVAAILHAFPDDEYAAAFDYQQHHHAHHGHTGLHSGQHNAPSSAGSVGSASASGYLGAHFAHSESASSLVSDVAGGLPAVVVPFDAIRQQQHQHSGEARSDGGADAMQGVVSGSGSRKRSAGEVGDDAEGHPAAKRQRASADRRHDLAPPTAYSYPMPASHAAAVYASSSAANVPSLVSIQPPPHTSHPSGPPAPTTTTSASASATWTGLSSVHLATYAPPPITPGNGNGGPSRFADLLRLRAAQASGHAAANTVGPGAVSHALGGPLSAALASANSGHHAAVPAPGQAASEAARRYHAPGPGEPPDQAGAQRQGQGSIPGPSPRSRQP